MNTRCCFLLLFGFWKFVLAQPLEKEEKYGVVIVGAGVSGFAAATALLADNYTDFIVLEAADRVGGRIHTVEFGGVPIDRGAQYVHGEKNNVVFEMVSPHDLIVTYSSVFKDCKDLFYDVSGEKYNASLVRPVVDQAWEILNGDYGGFNGSLAQYFYPKLDELLANHSVDAGLGTAMKHLLVQFAGTNSACDNLEEVGARGESRYQGNEGAQDWVWKPGTRGYKTIFDILSKKFPNPAEELPVMEKILLGKEVQKIERQGSGEVVLSCADGSRYKADHVIVTVSLGVLKKRAAEMFQPPLPQNKTDAIRTLGIGCVAKMIMLFPTRWWPADMAFITPLFPPKQLEEFRKNSTHGYWTSDTTGFLPMINHDRMLIVWIAGQACRTMESLTDAQVTDGLMELLNALVGHTFQIPRPEAILRSDWASYNYTLGAYSFYTVDSDLLNITRQHLSEPLMFGDKPVVMFAGEATNDVHWSTVHGALTTGRREADRVLRYIRSHS